MDRRVYDNYILKIAECGNLTRAAQALGISQPALSSGLNALEKELGFPVFHRRAVPISFTPEGTLYYDYLQRLRTISADFRNRIEALHDERNHAVTIGAPTAYVSSLISRAVVALLQEDSRCRVTIKSAPLSELVERATEGSINCFLSTSYQLPENFTAIPIRREVIYLCVPRSFSVNQGLEDYRVSLGDTGKLFDFSALNGESFVFLEENQPLQKQANQFFARFGITPRNNIVVDQVSSALSFVIRGEGICFASDESLQNVDLNSVSLYSLPESVFGRQTYIAYDRELLMPQACERLIAILRDEPPKTSAGGAL